MTFSSQQMTGSQVTGIISRGKHTSKDSISNELLETQRGQTMPSALAHGPSKRLPIAMDQKPREWVPSLILKKVLSSKHAQ